MQFVWLVVFKLILLSSFTICYVMGGRSNKWIRRFLGGIGFSAGIILLAVLNQKFTWWLLALPVAYPIALSLPYGADELWKKILLRAIYGLSFGLIGLYCGFILGNIYLGIVQLIMSIIPSMFLGVFNPTRAVDEEAMIGLSLVIHVPFML